MSSIETALEGLMSRVHHDGIRPPRAVSDEKFVSPEYTTEQLTRESYIAELIGSRIVKQKL